MIRFCVLLALCQGSLQVYLPRSGDPVYLQQSKYDAFVDEIRNLTDLWQPDTNVPPETVWSYRGGFRLDQLGLNRLPVGVLAVNADTEKLPERFDARQQWPDCDSVRRVRNQGCCSSSWAVAATSAMSDRWCIHSTDNDEFTFGSFELVACCDTCTGSDGCHGGTMGPTWEYWVNKGLSSGGPHNSGQGCLSYPFGECGDSDHDDTAPMCARKCQPGYNATLVADDRRYGRVAYSVPNDEESIMSEIYRHGPVQAGFLVHTDFLYYRSGVYRNVAGHSQGGHSVKILGWGVENGVKYWLCANSWGPRWGEKGFFKMLRGVDHLGIESDVHAGLPHFTKHLYNPYQDL